VAAPVAAQDNMIEHLAGLARHLGIRQAHRFGR
jgi:hypothetical protein